MLSTIIRILEPLDREIRSASEAVGLEMYVVSPSTAAAVSAGSGACGGSHQHLSDCRPKYLVDAWHSLKPNLNGAADERRQAALGSSEWRSCNRRSSGSILFAELTWPLAEPLQSIRLRTCAGNQRWEWPHPHFFNLDQVLGI